jgi:hypothetical protein
MLLVAPAQNRAVNHRFALSMFGENTGSTAKSKATKKMVKMERLAHIQIPEGAVGVAGPPFPW